jgi:hypothetical protein
MGNPGNHGQPGDWQPHQPPYGHGDDEPAKPYGQPPYGDAGEDTPRPGGSPYRSLDDEPYAGVTGSGLPPYPPDPDDMGSTSSYGDPTSSYGDPTSSYAGPTSSYGGSAVDDAYGTPLTSAETSSAGMWGDSGAAGGEPFTGPSTADEAYGNPAASSPSLSSLSSGAAFGGGYAAAESGATSMYDLPSEPVDPTEASMFGAARAGGAGAGSESGGALAPIGYERSRGYGGPSEPQRRRKLPMVLVASTVAVGFVLVGGGIAYSLRDSGSTGKPGAQPPPGAAKPSTPATPDPQALAKNIRSRKVDPKPLTLNEVFSETRFSEGGGSYIMTKRRTDRDCGDAVTGGSLEKALRKARCTQLLRATFSTTGGKLVGTIGIANLASEEAAQAAARAARGGRNYVEPLRGSGNTKRIGRSGSSAVGTADVRGHYLILSWVQYPDGKKIAKKHYPAITRFERNVIVGCNLGTALGHRMINSRPATTQNQQN